jgi:hypothetical protein
MTSPLHDQLESVARRAGTAVRAATQEVPVTVTDIVGLDTPTATVRRRWTLGIGLATAAVAVVAAGAFVLTGGDDEAAPLPADRTRSIAIDSDVASVSLAVPAAWRSTRWGQDVLLPSQLAAGQPPAIQLDPDADGPLAGRRVSVVLASSVPVAGVPDAEQQPVPDDLAGYLATVRGLEVSGLAETDVDGLAATQVDLRLPTPQTRTDPARVDLFCIGETGGYCQPVRADLQTARVVLVPVEGGAVVVVAEAPEAGSAAAYDALRTVLDGITIDRQP